MDPSHHSWLLGQSHPVIGLILIAIGVETQYRYVSRSLSGCGPKGGPNAPIAVDMPDHNRCRSRAHLLCRVPMNIRRRAHKV
jgi:hypothetical protein